MAEHLSTIWLQVVRLEAEARASMLQLQQLLVVQWVEAVPLVVAIGQVVGSQLFGFYVNHHMGFCPIMLPQEFFDF